MNATKISYFFNIFTTRFINKMRICLRKNILFPITKRIYSFKYLFFVLSVLFIFNYGQYLNKVAKIILLKQIFNDTKSNNNLNSIIEINQRLLEDKPICLFDNLTQFRNNAEYFNSNPNKSSVLELCPILPTNLGNFFFC